LERVLVAVRKASNRFLVAAFKLVQAGVKCEIVVKESNADSFPYCLLSVGFSDQWEKSRPLSASRNQAAPLERNFRLCPPRRRAAVD